MGKEYYERYWTKEIVNEQGFALSPPEHHQHDMDRMMSNLKPFLSGHVLDVGCGDGFITNAIMNIRSVEDIHGIDISKTAIHLAKAKYPHIDFEVGQVTELPFESNYFDAITAIELIEHIYDTEQMFKEFFRVLKNNGYLIVTTTDFNLFKKVIITLFYWDKYFYPTNPHIRFYSKKLLEKMLIKFGFIKVEHKWNGSYFNLMPKGQIMIAKKIENNKFT